MKKKDILKLKEDLNSQMNKIYGDLYKIEQKYKQLNMDPRYDHGYSFYRGKIYAYEYVLKQLS